MSTELIWSAPIMTRVIPVYYLLYWERTTQHLDRNLFSDIIRIKPYSVSLKRISKRVRYSGGGGPAFVLFSICHRSINSSGESHPIPCESNPSLRDIYAESC